MSKSFIYQIMILGLILSSITVNAEDSFNDQIAEMEKEFDSFNNDIEQNYERLSGRLDEEAARMKAQKLEEEKKRARIQEKLNNMSPEEKAEFEAFKKERAAFLEYKRKKALEAKKQNTHSVSNSIDANGNKTTIISTNANLSQKDLPKKALAYCYGQTNSISKSKCLSELRSIAAICHSNGNVGKDECNKVVDDKFPKCKLKENLSDRILCFKDLKLESSNIKLVAADNDKKEKIECDLAGRNRGWCGGAEYEKVSDSFGGRLEKFVTSDKSDEREPATNNSNAIAK